eukprot:scaffold21_cov368-Prasinococcus_capsulatus_cf.AAC.7
MGDAMLATMRLPAPCGCPKRRPRRAPWRRGWRVTFACACASSSRTAEASAGGGRGRRNCTESHSGESACAWPAGRPVVFPGPLKREAARGGVRQRGRSAAARALGGCWAAGCASRCW